MLHFLRHAVWILSTALLLCNCNAEVTFVDQDVSTASGSRVGVGRYFFDNGDAFDCSTIFLYGVGTAMSVSNYDGLSSNIVLTTPQTLVVVVDFNPGNFIKTSYKKFIAMVNAMFDPSNANAWFPEQCGGNVNTDRIIIGGHSASGQASLQALFTAPLPKKGNSTDDVEDEPDDNNDGSLSITPMGFIGFDPFNMRFLRNEDPNKLLEYPSLFWGLTGTTCAVTIANAALGAYDYASPTARILYRMSGTKHCVFADNGCPFCWNYDPAERAALWAGMAQSVAQFIESVDAGAIVRSDFELDDSVPNVALYVNDETVEGASGLTSVDASKCFIPGCFSIYGFLSRF